MSPRPIGSLAVLGVLLIAACGSPASASAIKTVGFRLTNTTAAPASEMFFDLVPAGTVVPPIIGTDPDGTPIEGSPMTALPSSTGIDVSTAFVLLTEDPINAEMERMFLLFGYEPDPDAPAGSVPFRPLIDDDGNRVGQLASGGAFDFELSLAQDTIGYLLNSGVDGLTLSILDLDSPGTDPDPGTDPTPPPPGHGTPIPEPSALLLWAAIGAGALAIARRRSAAVTAPA